MILASVQDKDLNLDLKKISETTHNEAKAVVTLPMPFDLGCYVHFDSRILEDLWTSYDIQIQRQCVLLTKCILQTSRVSFPPCLWSIEICFSTYSLLHLCPPRKKKLRNELRIQDRQDQLRQSQGFRSSCLTDVQVAIRVAKVTLLIKLLNINEKQA